MNEFDYLHNVVKRNWNSHSKSYQEQLTHSILGFVGEAGEVADLLKKRFHYGDDNPRNINADHFVDELGDCMYYLYMTCELLNINPDKVREMSEEKLTKRHNGNFNGNYKKEESDV